MRVSVFQCLCVADGCRRVVRAAGGLRYHTDSGELVETVWEINSHEDTKARRIVKLLNC